jgi:hypothetical protein
VCFLQKIFSTFFRFVHFQIGNSSESVQLESCPTSFQQKTLPWSSPLESTERPIIPLIPPVTSSNTLSMPVTSHSLARKTNEPSLFLLPPRNDWTNFQRRSFCCHHEKPDSSNLQLFPKSRSFSQNSITVITNPLSASTGVTIQ